MKRAIMRLLFLVLILGATSCGSSRPMQPDTTVPAKPESTSRYIVPPFEDAVFHGTPVTEPGTAVFDLSAIAQGYIGVSAIPAQEGKTLLFQSMREERSQNYSIAIPGDGTPVVLPITLGDGPYILRIMENTTDNSYVELARQEVTVTMEDEFQPYIRPSAYCPYTENAACVQLAADMAAHSTDAIDLVTQVFEYVKENITYDTERAQTVQKGYTTDPDETFTKGRGICFDYASLVAAMLRSQGIPTKIIFGNVVKDGEDIYHAWNMFYTKETGWITVEYKASGMEWSRLDLTFSSGGAEDSYMINDANYYDMKYY